MRYQGMGEGDWWVTSDVEHVGDLVASMGIWSEELAALFCFTVSTSPMIANYCNPYQFRQDNSTSSLAPE